MPETTVYDTENQFSWALKTYKYYDDGTPNLTYIEYDNGTFYIELCQLGYVSQTIREDVAADGGIFNWSSIYTHYDEYGTIIGVGIAYDNGILASRHYTDGLLEQIYITDQENVKDCHSDF